MISMGRISLNANKLHVWYITEMHMQVMETKNLIKSKGLKSTKGRNSVLRVLMESGKPLDVEEVYTRVAQGVHKVTVYRILEEFVRAGIVYQTDFHTGKALFEFQEKHHHHIVCTKCGRRENIDNCVDEEAINTKGFLIFGHVFELFGECKQCAVR